MNTPQDQKLELYDRVRARQLELASESSNNTHLSEAARLADLYADIVAEPYVLPLNSLAGATPQLDFHNSGSFVNRED